MPPVVIHETCVRPSKSRTVFQNKKISGKLKKLNEPVAANNGATARQLMAIFGWDTLKEAEKYTAKADQRRLAEKRVAGVLRPHFIRDARPRQAHQFCEWSVWAASTRKRWDEARACTHKSAGNVRFWG
jgi:hypothetical protein